ncbi:MAG: cytochrome c [Verrucomicrobiota bacterium]
MSDRINTPSNKPKSNAQNGAKKDEQALDYREDHGVKSIHEPILREKREPEDGNEPISLWIITLIGGLLFFGGLYMGMYGGGFNPEEYDERAGGAFAFGGGDDATSAKKVGSATGAGDDPIAKLMKRGKRIYSSNCASCHQSSGLGQAGIYPPLTASDWVIGDKNQRLVGVLLKGLEGPIHINGTKQSYSGVMQAWEKMLSDRDIAAVLTFIRGNSDWEHSAGPILPEEVAKMREEMASRTKPWTEAELESLPAGPIINAADAAGAEAANTPNE